MKNLLAYSPFYVLKFTVKSIGQYECVNGRGLESINAVKIVLSVNHIKAVWSMWSEWSKWYVEKWKWDFVIWNFTEILAVNKLAKISLDYASRSLTNYMILI